MLNSKYAIIGSGPAAFYAAEAIRKKDREGKLVIIGAEGYLPYFRPLTSYYLAGLVPKEKLFFRQADYYRRQKIEFIKATVTEVKGREKVLTFKPLDSDDSDDKEKSNQKLQFAKLLIASGAAPVKPDIPGMDIPGVYVLRTIDDAVKIAARAGKCKKAVLLGGGLVSLKTAYALHKIGLETTLVIASSQVLSQMLDHKGAEIIAAHLAKNGIGMVFKNDLAEIRGDGAGVTGVTLADGRQLETDLIVVGKGVKPVTSFLEGSGLHVERGVPVNDRLQTNLPDIYAAGDAALCRDILSSERVLNALWPNAAAQGEIAGANMSGERLVYRGSMRMNATEFFGLPVIAAGWSRVQHGAGAPWEIC